MAPSGAHSGSIHINALRPRRTPYLLPSMRAKVTESPLGDGCTFALGEHLTFCQA